MQAATPHARPAAPTNLTKVHLAQQLRFARWQQLNAIFVERLRAGQAHSAAHCAALSTAAKKAMP